MYTLLHTKCLPTKPTASGLISHFEFTNHIDDGRTNKKMMLVATQRRLFAQSIVFSTTLRLLTSAFIFECGELSSASAFHRKRSGPAYHSAQQQDGQPSRGYYASIDVRLFPILHRQKTSFRRKTRAYCSATAVRSSSGNESSPLQQESSVSIPLDSDDGKETWLVVGDGDLSYSAWAAQDLQDNVRLFASVLEDEETHQQVYLNSVSHADSIQASGHSVFFHVDATQLPSRFPPAFFDRIIFNFPHWRGKANNRYNRLLVNDFLQSAAQVLKPTTGEIHVALIPGQGGTNARNLVEWRQSWMVAQYASDHGLLLRTVRDFQVEYDLSSHRGVDRAFAIGDAPRQYILAHPNGDPVDGKMQMACRHELRIRLDESAIAAMASGASAGRCVFTREELIEGDAILQLVEAAVAGTGIRASVPLRDVVTYSEDEDSLLVLLLVYAGETQPLKRARADLIRGDLERAVTEQLGLEVVKKGKMVSKLFPLPMLDWLIENRGA
jgi:hypothetical protein